VVWLDAVGSTPATPLTVLNQVGTGWLAVEIPAGATGALALRISNGSTTSALVKLNAATPHHLDAMQIVPSGAFRLFGRNLALPGSMPTVMVDGQAASVNLAASDEHMLSVTAPAGLRASSAAVITVDNGNGSGASTLDRSINIATGNSGDPLGLGVGWAAAYAPLMGKIINAATDTRLSSRVICNGAIDDAPALAAALIFAQRNGGGVVTLPAGTCRLGRGVQIFSSTILQGAGKDKTTLQHDTDFPVFGNNMDVVAVRDLAIVNVGTNTANSMSLRDSSRIALQRLRIDLGAAKAMPWLYTSRNVAIVDSDFIQRGSLGAPGGPMLADNAGLVFTGNQTRFLNNIGTSFQGTRDAYIAGNTWTRDAIRQSDPGVVHTITLDFAHRIAVVNNSFLTVNGPVDPRKNDSEVILTEGGGGRRTEALGQVLTASASTLRDPSATVNPNALRKGALPENFGIAIVAGKGAGQARSVTGFSAGTFSIDKPWDVVPDTSSRYATAVWGIEKALIKGNSLSGSPRGILIYSTAAREVDIVANSMVENGGILVRSFQKVSAGWLSPLFNIRIEDNVISNSQRRAASTLSVHFANGDGQAFGTAVVGIEVRRNRLTANSPNIDVTNYMGPVGKEGYMNQMNVETSAYVPSSTPRLLGTVMQGNTCTQCATAFRLGTGAVGTMLSGNILVNSGGLWSNTATANSSDVALNTWVR
jgi:hypothetical protein